MLRIYPIRQKQNIRSTHKKLYPNIIQLQRASRSNYHAASHGNTHLVKILICTTYMCINNKHILCINITTGRHIAQSATKGKHNYSVIKKSTSQDLSCSYIATSPKQSHKMYVNNLVVLHPSWHKGITHEIVQGRNNTHSA